MVVPIRFWHLNLMEHLLDVCRDRVVEAAETEENAHQLVDELRALVHVVVE